MGENVEIYSNSKLAEALYEVLQEMLDEGKLPEDLCTDMLAQLDKSILKALKEEIQARADIRGHLDNYKYYDNVWQFGLMRGPDPKDPQQIAPVTFKLNASGTGSMKKAIVVTCDRMNVTCVDAKIALGLDATTG